MSSADRDRLRDRTFAPSEHLPLVAVSYGLDCIELVIRVMVSG